MTTVTTDKAGGVAVIVATETVDGVAVARMMTTTEKANGVTDAKTTRGEMMTKIGNNATRVTTAKADDIAGKTMTKVAEEDDVTEMTTTTTIATTAGETIGVMEVDVPTEKTTLWLTVTTKGSPTGSQLGQLMYR